MPSNARITDGDGAAIDHSLQYPGGATRRRRRPFHTDHPVGSAFGVTARTPLVGVSGNQPTVDPRTGPPRSPPGVCRYFYNNQPCRFGDRCKFRHERAPSATAVRESSRGEDLTRRQSFPFEPFPSLDRPPHYRPPHYQRGRFHPPPGPSLCPWRSMRSGYPFLRQPARLPLGAPRRTDSSSHVQRLQWSQREQEEEEEEGEDVGPDAQLPGTPTTPVRRRAPPIPGMRASTSPTHHHHHRRIDPLELGPLPAEELEQRFRELHHRFFERHDHWNPRFPQRIGIADGAAGNAPHEGQGLSSYRPPHRRDSTPFDVSHRADEGHRDYRREMRRRNLEYEDDDDAGPFDGRRAHFHHHGLHHHGFLMSLGFRHPLELELELELDMQVRGPLPAEELDRLQRADEQRTREMHRDFERLRSRRHVSRRPWMPTADAAAATDNIPTDPCCSICLEDFQVGDGVAVIEPCKHVHHEQCLRKWANEGKLECPQCRQPFLW